MSSSHTAARRPVSQGTELCSDASHRNAPLVYEIGRTRVIAIDGELDLLTVQQIEQLATHAAGHLRQIVVDLRAASPSIANPEVVALTSLLRRVGRRVAIAGGDPRARDVLTSIGLANVELTATVRDALLRLRQASADGPPSAATNGGIAR